MSSCLTFFHDEKSNKKIQCNYPSARGAIAGLSAVTIQAGPELRFRPALLRNFRSDVLLF
jgi:hypothetical protein